MHRFGEHPLGRGGLVEIFIKLSGLVLSNGKKSWDPFCAIHIPIGSMGLVYLPTFTIKITQM